MRRQRKRIERERMKESGTSHHNHLKRSSDKASFEGFLRILKWLGSGGMINGNGEMTKVPVKSTVLTR